MDWFSELLTADAVAALISLSAMEIVLGIDNVVFIAILASKLPPAQQRPARQLGLGLALITRLALLFTLSWILGLSEPLFSLDALGLPLGWLSIESREVSWRDLILLAGGLFLIGKSTFEIHEKLEGSEHHAAAGNSATFGFTLVQIMLLDIVFSIDSVITAVGMARQIPVMVLAMIIAVAVMLIFAETISGFVHRHPTLKMLALSFQILIGVMLVAEGLGQHIDRGYIYFAMGFSLVVEFLNLRLRRKTDAVKLREPTPPARGAESA